MEEQDKYERERLKLTFGYEMGAINRRIEGDKERTQMEIAGRSTLADQEGKIKLGLLKEQGDIESKLEDKRQAGQTARTTQTITAHAAEGDANRKSQETMQGNELMFKASEGAKQRKHELQKQQGEIAKELLLGRQQLDRLSQSHEAKLDPRVGARLDLMKEELKLMGDEMKATLVPHLHNCRSGHVARSRCLAWLIQCWGLHRKRQSGVPTSIR